MWTYLLKWIVMLNLCFSKNNTKNALKVLKSAFYFSDWLIHPDFLLFNLFIYLFIALYRRPKDNHFMYDTQQLVVDLLM